MKYYFKRGKWCVRDGLQTYKFGTESEAAKHTGQEITPFVVPKAGISVVGMDVFQEVEEDLREEEV